MIKRTIQAAGLAALALTALPQEDAEAACVNCSNAYMAAQQSLQETSAQGQATRAHISTGLQQLQMAITEALRLQTGEQTSAAKTQIAAQEKLMSADNAAEHATALQMRQAEIARRSSAGIVEACGGVTQSQRMGFAMAGGAGDATKSALADVHSSWDKGTGGAASSQEPATATRVRIDAAAQYCDEQLAAIGACEEPDEELGGATYEISKSLFGSMNLEDDRSDAADLYINNALNPQPMGSVKSIQGYNSENPEERRTAQSEINQRIIRRARLSMAEDTLNYIKADRTSVAEIPGFSAEGTSAAEQARAMAEEISGIDPSDFEDTDGISPRQSMDLTSKKWFLNPNWKASVATASTDVEVLKSMAEQMAFQIMQNQKLYDLLERMVAMQATELGMKVTTGQ